MLRSARLFIWIDAICIDQTDENEKAMQIPLMSEIYKRAYQVNVWLGLPSYGTGLVFHYTWLEWCRMSLPKSASGRLERLAHRVIKGCGLCSSACVKD